MIFILRTYCTHDIQHCDDIVSESNNIITLYYFIDIQYYTIT